VDSNNCSKYLPDYMNKLESLFLSVTHSLMSKQIYAVMLTRQQPCPAVRVGTSGCDDVTLFAET
jgi:hypothetical protein